MLTLSEAKAKAAALSKTMRQTMYVVLDYSNRYAVMASTLYHDAYGYQNVKRSIAMYEDGALVPDAESDMMD